MTRLQARPTPLVLSACIIAPLLLVQVAQFLFLETPGPRAASASVPEDGPGATVEPVAPPVKRPVHDADFEAWQVNQLQGASLPTPFPVQAAPAPDQPDSHPQGPAPAHQPAARPRFVLSAVSGGKGRTPVAILNGKLRREGDVLAPGYRITAIDPDTGVVMVEGPDGKEAHLSIRR
jgi:hypothetical protein